MLVALATGRAPVTETCTVVLRGARVAPIQHPHGLAQFGRGDASLLCIRVSDGHRDLLVGQALVWLSAARARFALVVAANSFAWE